MPLIAMNREIGSLGKDVAKGLAEALDLKARHHELIDRLATRARLRKGHVISFLDGTQGLFERLGMDETALRMLVADEVFALASSDTGVILRGWGATALFRQVPHAVRVCVTAPRELRIKRMMQRIDEDDPNKVAGMVDRNDQTSRAVMLRHYSFDCRDVNEYDVGFNTERMSVAHCVDRIVDLVRSPQFAQTEESLAKLRDLAAAQHVRTALRTNASTANCQVKVSAGSGRVTLEGVVAGSEQRRACVEIISRVKGVTGLENFLQVAEVPVRQRGDG